MKEKELKKAAPESSQNIEVESFLLRKEVDYVYFNKPYYAMPAKNREKGCLILREVLRKTDTVAFQKL